MEVEEDVNAEDDEGGEETALAATPVAAARRPAARAAPKLPKATWVGEPLADADGVKTYRCVCSLRPSQGNHGWR